VWRLDPLVGDCTIRIRHQSVLYDFERPVRVRRHGQLAGERTAARLLGRPPAHGRRAEPWGKMNAPFSIDTCRPETAKAGEAAQPLGVNFRAPQGEVVAARAADSFLARGRKKGKKGKPERPARHNMRLAHQFF